MSTVLDIAAVAAPAATALVGAYGGAHWRSQSEADAELRALLDDAITALQRVAQKLDAAQRTVPVEGADSGLSLRLIEDLDSERGEAEQIADRIMGRTEEGAPVYEHYVSALRHVEHGRGMLLLLAGSVAGIDQDALHAEARDVLGSTSEGFGQERYLFRRAVQARIAPRRRWWRPPPATPSAA